MTTVTDNPQSVENQNFKLVQSIRLYLQNHLKVSCKLSIGSITKKNDPQSSTTLMFFTVDNQLAFAILYSIYLDQDCFYLNIEKVDSTHISIKSLPTNAILGIISYYESILPRLKVHVYAATAKQYLFPKSHLQESKSLKSDRQLISWWIYCLSHPFKYQSNKYWFVPGETSISVSRLLSSNHHDQWKWGLGVDDTSNAHDLFQFPDDLITKTLEYAPEKCTVQELKELMGCMENASGLRALMVLEFQNNTLDSKKLKSIWNDLLSTTDITPSHQFQQFLNQWILQSYETEAQSVESSKKVLDDYTKLTSSSLTELSIEVKEDCNIKSLVRKETDVNDINNLVRKKPKVNKINNLVRKKPEIHLINNLVKRKPKE